MEIFRTYKCKYFSILSSLNVLFMENVLKQNIIVCFLKCIFLVFLDKGIHKKILQKCRVSRSAIIYTNYGTFHNDLWLILQKICIRSLHFSHITKRSVIGIPCIFQVFILWFENFIKIKIFISIYTYKFIRLEIQLRYWLSKDIVMKRNCILKGKKNKNDSYRSNIFCNKSR